MKIRNSTLNRLVIVELVKKMVCLGSHHSERQGLMGYGFFVFAPWALMG